MCECAFALCVVCVRVCEMSLHAWPLRASTRIADQHAWQPGAPTGQTLACTLHVVRGQTGPGVLKATNARLSRCTPLEGVSGKASCSSSWEGPRIGFSSWSVCAHKHRHQRVHHGTELSQAVSFSSTHTKPSGDVRIMPARQNNCTCVKRAPGFVCS